MIQKFGHCGAACIDVAVPLLPLWGDMLLIEGKHRVMPVGTIMLVYVM